VCERCERGEKGYEGSERCSGRDSERLVRGNRSHFQGLINKSVIHVQCTYQGAGGLLHGEAGGGLTEALILGLEELLEGKHR
jgi:hypothetical protein